MHLTPKTVALSFALTFAFAASDPTASAPARPSPATPEALSLATTLVGVSDERANATKALEPLENLMSGWITTCLSTTDPSVIAQVKQIVRDALSPIQQQAVDAMVDSYAASFSTEELGRAIAFAEGPEGQAEKANLPLLKKDLAAALSGSSKVAKAGDSASQVFAAASPERRAFVQRILVAQHFEARTRRNYATLGAMIEAAALRAGLGTSTGKAGSRADAKAADNYVRLVTEVEEDFYVTHYTDAQLTGFATYLESEPGQAFVTRMPKVRKALSSVVAHGLLGAVSKLPDRVCKAVACTPDQRTRLAELTTVMSAASALGFPGLTDSSG